MSTISNNDILIIIKGAIKMAQKDKVMDEEERLFLEDLLMVTQIEGMEQLDIDDPIEENILELSEQLSTAKARKAFLLTLGAVALADEVLDEKELKFLDEMTENLKVGRVKIRELNFNKAKNLVLKMLAQTWPMKDKKEKSSGYNTNQPSDMDLEY